MTYVTYVSYVTYLTYIFRWPDKRYTIICPPPSTRKSPSEVKAAKEAAREARISGKAVIEEDPEAEAEQANKGVMYHEYDLMFHYLLASLRRADGKNSVTATGTKLFDIFAGLGQHR